MYAPFILGITMFLASPPANNQQSKPEVAAPHAFATIESLMDAAYTTISGPAGQKRDWELFRSLFVPGARLIPAGPDKSGHLQARVFDVEAFIRENGNYFETNGFYERDVFRRTEIFGNIAHVLSTYESRHKAADPKPFARGINSFQLFNDGTRWWVVTIYWQEENSKEPIPTKYLKSRR